MFNKAADSKQSRNIKIEHRLSMKTFRKQKALSITFRNNIFQRPRMIFQTLAKD